MKRLIWLGLCLFVWTVCVQSPFLLARDSNATEEEVSETPKKKKSAKKKDSVSSKASSREKSAEKATSKKASSKKAASKKATSKKTSSKKAKKEKYDPYDSEFFVKTPTELKADFAAIRRAKISTTGEISGAPEAVTSVLARTNQTALAAKELKTLMMYRAVVGIPFEDLTLDRQQTAHALAACHLLQAIGTLSHNPERPENFPQDVFDFASVGTSCSNLHMGAGMNGSVRAYMDDSDPSNIDRLGHRRWCIHPGMRTTGFGEYDKYSAMWSFDRSRPDGEFDYDFVAFPARGFTPSAMLDKDWAWNVSLHPQKYKLTSTPEEVKVTVTPASFQMKTGTFQAAKIALPLDSVRVSTEGFGIPLCVIFRPMNVHIAPGNIYCVTITGFSDSSGTEKVICYYVCFCGDI